MCNLMICKLKMCPSSPSNECTAHRVCPKEPRLAINNAYRSCLGQYRLVTQRGKLFGLDALCAPCQLLIIDQFWFITLPQSVMGRSDCSIIKNPHFGSPPPPFFKIFFFWTSSLPPKRLQMQTQIQRLFLTTNEDRKDDLHIFHREMITNLTPCWQLVNTLLTPCWQLYKCNNLTFLWQMFDKCFHAKWVFSRCSDQVLSNVHGNYWAVNINIDFVKEGVGIRIQS